ncbi:MAG: hypothetical protein AMXMBFR82_12600 [Candidatus Hydrogenedentota bacterium]
MASPSDLYLRIFESLHDPMILLDPAGNVVHRNLAATTLFAETPETNDRAGADDANRHLPSWLDETLRSLMSGIRRMADEYKSVKTRTGTRHFEIELERIVDDRGNLQGMAVILHDITELKEAENAVRYRSEFGRIVSEISSRFVGVFLEEYDAVLEESLRGVGQFLEADTAYVFQFTDSGARLSMTHLWDSGEFDGPMERISDLDAAALPWWLERLQHAEVVALSSLAELPAEAAAERALLESQGVHSLVHVPLHYKGEVLGFMGLGSEVQGRTWTQDEINLLKIVAQVFTNALQHKRAEETLGYERNLLRTVVDNLPDYIYAKDASSRFVLNNRAHTRLLRANAPEEVFGKTDYDIFPRGLADQYFADEQQVIESGQALVNREESVLTEDGTPRWLLTTKVPWFDKEGKPQGIVGMSRDITQRKELAQALESHAQLLEQANEELRLRNQELDEFTYIASHDLQEPLRKLIAFSDVLQEDMKAGDQKEVVRDLGIIASAAQRMQTLVKDLLALSRSGRQSMSWESVDLAECVALVLDTLEVRIRDERAVVEQDCLPTVMGDRTLLAQLYQNLIGNALKFHGDKSPVIRLTAEETPDGWLLGVSDNGIGIKKEYAEQIFAPFKRLHGRSEYEGTGIGLAICRKIVERHGGKIWVESAPGEGARFKFTLDTEEGAAGR